MKLREFLVNEAPRYCGVHPSNGVTSGLVFDAEVAGEKAYAAESFESMRDRAKAYVPYAADESTPEQRSVVDVVELAICSHRQAEHEEVCKERIEELELALVSEEPEFLTVFSTEDAKSPGWNG